VFHSQQDIEKEGKTWLSSTYNLGTELSHPFYSGKDLLVGFGIYEVESCTEKQAEFEIGAHGCHNGVKLLHQQCSRSLNGNEAIQ
jgi:hypothetical protein